MDKVTAAQHNDRTPPKLTVKILRGEAAGKEYEFENSFKIGREESCAIPLNDEMVSRVHVEVKLENNQWWIYDLNSTNGVFLNGEKINRHQLSAMTEIEFGIRGPLLSFDSSQPLGSEADPKSLTRYIDHYFNGGEGEGEIGQHTRMIREAFGRVQKKKATKYYIIIGSVVFLMLMVTGYSVYQHIQANEQKKLAEEIFYNMKSLELQLAQLQKSISRSEDKESQRQIEQYNASRADMEASYDRFVRESGFYSDKDESERLILKLARIFGECELNAPPGFVLETKKYIKNWQSTNRLTRAIQRANDKQYADIIADKMLASHLPPQFFYLALQESDFNHQIVGPQTKYGYAKGIWQFIPATALKYGLKTGPLVEMNQFDPRDDRFDFEKATEAASLYISDIYNTEAQASGLLVIASYNWGEQNVRSLISKLPSNPRERNFWKLLEKYQSKIPNETYQYVFYIFSAAVIGENPEHFGFNFINPLKSAIENTYP